MRSAENAEVPGVARFGPTWSVRKRGEYISQPAAPWNLTTLAFWLRSSVVSVLYSLTTITTAMPSFVVILIFAALRLSPGLLGWLHHDLGFALPPCVVMGSSLLFVAFGSLQASTATKRRRRISVVI